MPTDILLIILLVFFFLLWEKSFFHWQLGNIIRKLSPTATGNSWRSGHLWSEWWTQEWSYMWLEHYSPLHKLTPYFHRKIMIITIRIPGAIKLSPCCRGQWYVVTSLISGWTWVHVLTCPRKPLEEEQVTLSLETLIPRDEVTCHLPKIMRPFPGCYRGN